MRYLQEHLNFNQAKIRVLVEDEGKTLYMEGVCIEGGVKNANERVYPVEEISRAVDSVNKQVHDGYSVLGEVDHPEDLKINLDKCVFGNKEVSYLGFTLTPEGIK